MEEVGTRESHFNLRCLALVAFLACATLPLHAGGKVETAWDKNADFSKYRTYAWADRPATTRPFVGIEIRANADEQLKMKGLTINKENPDLILNFYGSVDASVSGPAADPLYTGTGGTPLPGTTMWTNNNVGTVTSVPKGTLILDARDATTHHSVWRSIAKGTLKEKSSQLQKQVQNSIARMFQDFPPPKSAE